MGNNEPAVDQSDLRICGSYVLNSRLLSSNSDASGTTSIR